MTVKELINYCEENNINIENAEIKIYNPNSFGYRNTTIKNMNGTIEKRIKDDGKNILFF